MTTDLISQDAPLEGTEADMAGQPFVEATLEACLDRRTRALASLAVAAALHREGRLATCVAEAKAAGAARSEVVGAILAGLADAGLPVLSMVAPALKAFDEPYQRGQD